MKENEIRIGNWVKFEHGNGYEEIVQFKFDNWKYFYGTTTTPIPLTEEWLIKFGFEGNIIAVNDLWIEHDGDVGYYLADDHSIGVGMDYIKYVHQLQNLYFALTGEELTIK